MVSAPRTAERGAAGAPAASQPPILALSPPCALGAGGRVSAQGLRGLLWPASGESSCGRETLSPAGAPNLSSFRGGCCVSQTENKSLSWRGGAPAFLLLFLRGDRSRSTPREPGFASAVNQGCQALLGLPPGRGGAERCAELAPQRRAGRELPSPARASRPGTAGIPGYKRARSHTHSHTHTRPHTSPEPGLRRGLSGAFRGPGSCCWEWGRKPSSGSWREAPRA